MAENIFRLKRIAKKDPYITPNTAVEKHIYDAVHEGGGSGEPFEIQITVANDGTATTTVTAEELAEHCSNCVLAVKPATDDIPATYYKPTVYINGSLNGTDAITQVSFVGPTTIDDDRYFWMVQVVVFAQNNVVNAAYAAKRYFGIPDYFNDGSKQGDVLTRDSNRVKFLSNT